MNPSWLPCIGKLRMAPMGAGRSGADSLPKRWAKRRVRWGEGERDSHVAAEAQLRWGLRSVRSTDGGQGQGGRKERVEINRYRHNQW